MKTQENLFIGTPDRSSWLAGGITLKTARRRRFLRRFHIIRMTTAASDTDLKRTVGIRIHLRYRPGRRRRSFAGSDLPTVVMLLFKVFFAILTAARIFHRSMISGAMLFSQTTIILTPAGGNTEKTAENLSIIPLPA